jgi:hypothetical protein
MTVARMTSCLRRLLRIVCNSPRDLTLRRRFMSKKIKEKSAYEIIRFLIDNDLIYSNFKGRTVMADDAEEKLEEFLKSL